MSSKHTENIQFELTKSVIKFEQVARTRWLSFKSCVHVVSMHYSRLLRFLREYVYNKATSILQKIIKYKFMHVFALLARRLEENG